MVRLRQDPVAEVLEVVHGLYPALDIVIDFYEEPPPRWWRRRRPGEGWGACQFLPGGKVEIGLNINTPYKFVPEILAHEVAHAVVGKDVPGGHEHGEAWEREFDRIFQAHVALVNERHPEMRL